MALNKSSLPNRYLYNSADTNSVVILLLLSFKILQIILMFLSLHMIVYVSFTTKTVDYKLYMLPEMNQIYTLLKIADILRFSQMIEK
jgi:hypothetical protein